MKKIGQNAVAALTVSFVALSLGAAFGVLSGRGAFSGMISAALIAGIASLFGGTRIQCSGPTGPMTAVTAVVVAFAHDMLANRLPGMSADEFVNIVLALTAALLVIMGLLRLGKYIVYVPNVVISGFMNGIAIIIWLDQLKRLFGWGGKVAFTGPLWENVAVAFFSALLAFILPKFFQRVLPAYASLLSGTFLTIVLMTGFSFLFHLPIEHVQLTGSLHSWAEALALVQSQLPTHWSFSVLLIAAPFALQLAVLGYLDTLLTSLVIDKMTHEKTKQNKELLGQGLAMGVVSLVGGIPGAQATIRSVLIVKEKATSRFAGILVGIFALAEMILFQNTINLIPQAVFSGILIKVGYDVFDWLPLRLYAKEWARERYRMIHDFFDRRDDAFIFVTNREIFMIVGTTLVTAAWDLNLAVGIFTTFFYLHNKVLNKKNPMRDLRPVTETEGMED